ncbi:unnamed protein product [Polarella glacialis]|uniref:Uncharacterized protein n=2 Tax=Polarella glacialis TaxID=89957 RepID=A0A813GEA7_POLGL|nr:unnamed protein product [Polarella glacialis]
MAHLNGRSKENTMSGLFHLGDIPPAPGGVPGGVPQSEVTLDIDANDMLKVNAPDKPFGKCYQSTIMNKKCRPSQMTIDRSPSVRRVRSSGARMKPSIIRMWPGRLSTEATAIADHGAHLHLHGLENFYSTLRNTLNEEPLTKKFVARDQYMNELTLSKTLNWWAHCRVGRA